MCLGVCFSGRLCDALGVSKNVVSRIKRHGESGAQFETPGKRRKMKRRKRDIDDFTKCAIRNLIYEFNRKRKMPTTGVESDYFVS